MINLKVTSISYCKNISAEYQCGFRKGFSTQHCPLAIIEKLRKSLDSWGDSVLIAKLHVYGIKKESLNLLFSYLKKRKQRVRRNNETVAANMKSCWGLK